MNALEVADLSLTARQEICCGEREYDRRLKQWEAEGEGQAEQFFKQYCAPEIERAAGRGLGGVILWVGTKEYGADAKTMSILGGRTNALKKLLSKNGYTYCYAQPERRWLYEGPHDWDDVLYNEDLFVYVNWLGVHGSQVCV